MQIWFLRKYVTGWRESATGGLNFDILGGRGTGAPQTPKFFCQFFGKSLKPPTPSRKPQVLT